jgi:hypothetical protein
MDLPSKHVLYFSKRIGARGAGSDGEAAAASYVLRTFRDSDLEVDMETFSSWKSDMHGLVILCLLAIGAYLLFRLSYPIGLTIAILVFLVFQMETYTWAIVSRLLPHSSASNVIGRVRPASGVQHKVVIVANYDSAKSSPLGGRRTGRLYRLLYIIAFACIIAVMLVGIFGVGASLTKISAETVTLLWMFAAPFPAYLAILVLVILWGESRGRYTAGANDNASGVGAMLSVMASVAESPLERTEVWGVATGRGCAGARGMIAFLHRHRHTLRDAYIINLDHCGIGDTKIITREGVMFGFRCSWRLRRWAMDAARSAKGLDLGKGKCRVKKSDAMAALVRGYRSVTIGGLVGGTFTGWRNKDDTLDTIQRESLDRAVKLVGFLLEEIDGGPRRKKAGRRRPRRREEELEAEEEPEHIEGLPPVREELPLEPAED